MQKKKKLLHNALRIATTLILLLRQPPYISLDIRDYITTFPPLRCLKATRCRLVTLINLARAQGVNPVGFIPTAHPTTPPTTRPQRSKM